MPKYRIVGKAGCYGVTEDGAMLYDLLESRQEAKDIQTVLRQGIGPEWDSVEPALEQIHARRVREG